MRHGFSFTKRLSLRVIRTTAILFVSANLIIVLFSFSYMFWRAVRDSSSMLKSNLLEVENVFSDVESASRTAALIISDSGMSAEALLSITRQMVAADTNIVGCALAYDNHLFHPSKEYFCPSSYSDSTGLIHSEIIESNYSGKEWYSIPKGIGKNWWSDPFMDTGGSGKLVSSFSTPIYDQAGNFLAILRCDMDLKWLSRKIQELRPYENSYTLLAAGRDASIIFCQNLEKNQHETLFSVAASGNNHELRDIARRMVGGETGYGKFENEYGKCLIVFGHLKNGWSAAVISTFADVFDDARHVLLISVIVLLVSVLLLYLIDRKIVEEESSPITALAYSALSIAQGNFKARIPEVESQDELRRLSDSLHYLEDSIDMYIDELRNVTVSNERYESELNIASSIQMQMLPTNFIQTEELELYAALYPAKEVGGDLYDFFVKGRMLYFAVGDVSGKGVPAALYMAITRSAFRFIAGLDLPINEVVSKINAAFCDGNDSGMFVTMFVGRVNLDTLQLEYCNAGHNPMIIISPDGKANFLHAKANLAAGLFPDFSYEGESLMLERGSRLLIYTDGVTEAENWNHELYGNARLEAFAGSEDLSVTSRQFTDDLVTDLKSFTQGNPQNDDITVMMVKF